MRASLLALFLACAGATAVPLFAERAPAAPEGHFPGWPTDFENRPLRALPLGERERRFAADFPGHIGRFSDGRREIVVRWVSRPTRMLHPAADCFRGSGYSIVPGSLAIAADGGTWGRFSATRGKETLEVRERIYDAAGNEWTDVSAWYWAAAAGTSRGPWWAVTVAAAQRPIAQPDD